MFDPFLISFILVKLGLLTLFTLTWQDFKTGKVDTRKTSFMIGASLIAFFALVTNIIAILPVMAIAWACTSLFKKTFGVGDIQSFYWIVPTLFILGWWYPLVLIPIIGLMSLMTVFIKMHNGIIGKTPGMIIFTSAYLLIVLYHFYYTLWPDGCAISSLCWFR